VTVDNGNAAISVEGKNCKQITWVIDGNAVLRGGGDSDIPLADAMTLNLNDYNVEYFVRFYLVGDDGICYSQPFAVDKEGVEREPVEVPETNDVSTKLRKLVTVVDALFFRYNLFIKLFKLVALGYWDSFC